MKEYTVLALISVFITLLIDRLTGVRILRRREFYIFILVIIFFKFLVNGYLTGERIIIYNPKMYLGYRIGSIPLEDFLFGFSMVTLTLVFWEYFKGRGKGA